MPCPQGSTSPSGYLPCTKCPIGYYQPYEGQQVCAKCPKGFANEAEGAINCTNITTAVKQQQQQQQEDDNNKVTIATMHWLNVNLLNNSLDNRNMYRSEVSET